MKVSTLVMVVITIVCTATAAFADSAPSWRGMDGTTFEQWMFNTDASPASPTSAVNPYGTTNAVIDYDSPTGTGWYDTMPDVYGSAQGWWDIAGGSITITIPNRPTTDPNSYKDILIQIKYWKDFSAAPSVQISPTASTIERLSSNLLESGPVGGAWYMDTWQLYLTPNPDFETITIIGDQKWGSQIDEIIIDTKCTTVPEPGGIMVLLTAAVSMAGFAARRRRA